MKYTKENIEPIVIKCKSIRQVILSLGLNPTGGNHTHISKTIKKFNINTSHFLGKLSSKGKILGSRLSKEEFITKILIINGSWNSHNIKLKLFQYSLKERKCEKCGQNEIWFSEKLGLELDHINGIHNDNRFENLRILCPNCHSQTSTHSNKKNKKEKKPKEIKYCECGNIKSSKAKVCIKCSNSFKQRKIKERPNIETLLKNVKILGYRGTGKKYGVSDNAIRKWIKIKTQ